MFGRWRPDCAVALLRHAAEHEGMGDAFESLEDEDDGKMKPWSYFMRAGVGGPPRGNGISEQHRRCEAGRWLTSPASGRRPHVRFVRVYFECCGQAPGLGQCQRRVISVFDELWDYTSSARTGLWGGTKPGNELNTGG